MKSQQYDPFGAELRRFSETLDRRNFRTVAPGFGFAEVSKVETRPQARPLTPNFNGHTAWHKPQKMEAAPLEVRPPLTYKNPQPPPPARTGEVGRRHDVAPAPKVAAFHAVQPPTYAPLPPLPSPSTVQQERPSMSRAAQTLVRPASDPSAIEGFSQGQMAALLQDTLRPPRRIAPAFFMKAVTYVMRLVAAHMIDMAAVLVSLSVALFIAGSVLHQPVSGQESLVEAVFKWAPVQMLLQMGLLYFGLLIYVLFGGYWLFLKLAVGTTLGHTLMGFAIGREMRKS